MQLLKMSGMCNYLKIDTLKIIIFKIQMKRIGKTEYY